MYAVAFQIVNARMESRHNAGHIIGFNTVSGKSHTIHGWDESKRIMNKVKSNRSMAARLTISRIGTVLTRENFYIPESRFLSKLDHMHAGMIKKAQRNKNMI